MSQALEKADRVYDYELMFRDSPEYYCIENAKMFQEGAMITFMRYEQDELVEQVWFPLSNIYRVKRYAE